VAGAVLGAETGGATGVVMTGVAVVGAITGGVGVLGGGGAGGWGGGGGRLSVSNSTSTVLSVILTTSRASPD